MLAECVEKLRVRDAAAHVNMAVVQPSLAQRPDTDGGRVSRWVTSKSMWLELSRAVETSSTRIGNDFAVVGIPLHHVPHRA